QLLGANALTEMLLTEVLKHGKVGDEKRAPGMVNNLGATTEMQLGIVARHAVPFLQNNRCVERIYAGTFHYSLDMSGISISVLGINDERLCWLDAATTAPAWPDFLKRRPGKQEVKLPARVSTNVKSFSETAVQTETGGRLKRSIEAACQAL